tara:strand:+ start:2531 stop:3592 length:1062 start_codon:yes stop_codon:yes gene_type:complete
VKKILITTGGTGGHVIPAEIIAEHLTDKYEIYFSTDLRGQTYLEKNDNITVIDTPQLSLNFSFPFRLFKLFYLTIKSISFLKKKKIDKLISTGGYMSLPLCLGAKFLGLKIFLLEPNSTIGRANKFYLSFSEKIICYSENIINFPKKFDKKKIVIQPLVSKKFYEVEKKKNIGKKFCILISGGSQGAKIFDEILSNVIIDLGKIFSIKIIQQTKIENNENLKKLYNNNQIENQIFSFEKNFFNLINEADLCITRAGATSLAEISLMNKPFVAIPLPSAKDNHQMENAKIYEKLDCCWVLDQKLLNKDNIAKFLSNILEDKTDYMNKKKNLINLNYQNTWNDVNQKLREIIDEN